MPEPKDWWDKAEIIGKIAVPVLIGFVVLFWNSQRTAHETRAAMTQIAIGILSERPEEGQPTALREWAIAVLQNPTNPPRMSDEAARQLRFEPLSAWAVEQMTEALRELARQGITVSPLPPDFEMPNEP